MVKQIMDRQIKRPRCEVRLLGPFRLTLDGRILETERWQRRPASLLRLLAGSKQHRRGRDEVIDLFWPDSEPTAGAGNLRYVLHLLRRAFPDHPAPIRSEGGWVMLNDAYDWEIDLERLEDLLTGSSEDLGQLREAATLFADLPCPEDRYEDWAAPLRERIGARMGGVFRRLAVAAHDTGDALEWYERARALDPLDEQAIGGLARSLLRAGRRTDALRRLEGFNARLREELGVEPGDATAALVEEVRSATEMSASIAESELAISLPPPVHPTYPLPSSGFCVGRDRELVKIEARFPGVESDTRLVLLRGEAGVGKTWLLGEVARRARERGILVLAGGCYEAEGRLPYGPFHDALTDYLTAQSAEGLQRTLGDLLPDLARLVPERHRSTADSETDERGVERLRLRLFTAAAGALERIVRQAPLLLILDDLHWADEGSLQLLHFLIRQPSLAGLLILGTYRTEDALPSLLQLRERPDVLNLEIPALSREEITVLLEDRLGGPCDPALVKTLLSRCGGNPFFILQTVRLLQSEGSLGYGSAGWTIAPDAPIGLPPAIEGTIARRLSRLDEAQGKAIAIGAVLGREFSFPAIAALWPDGEDALFAALDGALDAFLVSETGTGYTFRHPLLREVAYSRIPLHRRRKLHSAAGRTLEHLYGEDAPQHAAELAHHFVNGRPDDGAHALRYLRLAAEAAERAYAYDKAAADYQTALTLLQPGDVQLEITLRRALGESLYHTARFAVALEVLETVERLAAGTGDRTAAVETTGQIADVLWKLDRATEGEVRLRAVLDDTSNVPDDVRTRLLFTLSRLLALQGRFRESLDVANQGASLAMRLGDVRLASTATVARSEALMNLGMLDEARAEMESQVGADEATDDPHHRRFFWNNLGVICWLRGALPDSHRYLSQSADLARRLGDPIWIMFGLAVLGHTEFFMGRWEEASEHLREAAMRAEQLGATWQGAYADGCYAALLAGRGEWRGARGFACRSVEAAERTKNMEILPYMHAVLAEADLREGRVKEVFERLERFLSVESSGLVPALISLARAHMRRGEYTHAADLVERALAATSAGCRVFLPDALREHGELLVLLGRYDEAESAFTEAVERAHDMPYPRSAGRSLLSSARLDLARGDSGRAREHLDRARVIFTDLGAADDLRETERCHVRLLRRAPGYIPPTGAL